jgi:hypothetical protein
MLVVKIEIWPLGNKEDASEIATFYISNVSQPGTEKADYWIEKEDYDHQRLFLGEIKKHKRSSGFLSLVIRALNLIKKKCG